MDKIISYLRELNEYFFFISFGGVGGIVYLFLTNKDFGYKALFKAFFVSAFTGLLSGMLTQYAGYAQPLAYVISGLSGFAGGFALIWMLYILAKRFGIDSKDVLHSMHQSVQKTEAPEYILTELLQQSKITSDDCKQILDGDFSSLFALFKNDELSGIDLEAICDWQANLHKKES